MNTEQATVILRVREVVDFVDSVLGTRNHVFFALVAVPINRFS